MKQLLILSLLASFTSLVIIILLMRDDKNNLKQDNNKLKEHNDHLKKELITKSNELMQARVDLENALNENRPTGDITRNLRMSINDLFTPPRKAKRFTSMMSQAMTPPPHPFMQVSGFGLDNGLFSNVDLSDVPPSPIKKGHLTLVVSNKK